MTVLERVTCYFDSARARYLLLCRFLGNLPFPGQFAKFC